MTLRARQPEALDLLDATVSRAEQVVDPRLLAMARACVECHVADGPQPPEPVDEAEAEVRAVIEQMLIDVSRLDDATVQRAASRLPEGALADLVMASYAIEARTRLRVASDRLLGGLG